MKQILLHLNSGDEICRCILQTREEEFVPLTAVSGIGAGD